MFRGSSIGELPESGIYEISYTLSGLRPPKGRAPRLKVYHELLDRVLFEQDIVADEDKPITVTFRAHLPKARVVHRPASTGRLPEFPAQLARLCSRDPAATEVRRSRVGCCELRRQIGRASCRERV